MAFNPSDTTFWIVPETAAGTTPATPAFLKFDRTGDAEPKYAADFVTSQVMKQGRASAGGRKVNFRVDGGSLETELFRDAAIDALLESALSGAFATNTLKGGQTDKSLTIEKKMVDGATTEYKRWTGCQVKSFSLSVDASSMSSASFDIIGMGSTTAAAIITGATYANAASTQKLAGLDVGSVSVAGITGDFRKLELTVSHNRETQDKFGSSSARAVGTSGNRTVELTLELYRTTGFTPETVCTPDTPIAVSFAIGSGVNGYTVALPAAIPYLPEDTVDSSKQLVTLKFVASYDATAATDIVLTKTT